MPPPRSRQRRDRKHFPVRRVRLGHEIGERDCRDEQNGSAEDRPVAAAECRDRESIGKAHQRADQPGQRHELKQLIGREVEAGLRQLGRDDAPDQPDRKADMLGNDRPDQITPGDELALGFPKRSCPRDSSRKSSCSLRVLSSSKIRVMHIPGDLAAIAGNKKRRAQKDATLRFLRDSGVAVGPSLDLGRSLWRRPSGSFNSSFVPTYEIAISNNNIISLRGAVFLCSDPEMPSCAATWKSLVQCKRVKVYRFFNSACNAAT